MDFGFRIWRRKFIFPQTALQGTACPQPLSSRQQLWRFEVIHEVVAASEVVIEEEDRSVEEAEVKLDSQVFSAHNLAAPAKLGLTGGDGQDEVVFNNRAMDRPHKCLVCYKMPMRLS